MTLNRFGNSSLGSVEKRPQKLNILLQRESFITKVNRCNYLGPKKKKRKKLCFNEKIASSTDYLLFKSGKNRGNNHWASCWSELYQEKALLECACCKIFDECQGVDV